MKWKIHKSRLSGTVNVPPSKSHTIRAIIIASLAGGTSAIHNPLLKGDGNSALQAAEKLGAGININNNSLDIRGADIPAITEEIKIDMGNSGTSARLFAAAASLSRGKITFSGDKSLSARPMKPLLEALKNLGADYTLHSSESDFPFTVSGPASGGSTQIKCHTSQYLSALLLISPLFPHDTVIRATELNETPYVDMTLWWLDKMNIKYSVSGQYERFNITGTQKYFPINETIPGDFSSASFPAAGACITKGSIKCGNLDFSDPQGDKELFTLLREMGAQVDITGKEAAVKSTGPLRGRVIDLNRMPDALPVLSVAGCLAEGKTEIVNVAQARLKETDRIKVMTEELRKMNASIEERPDGLVIKHSELKGAGVDSRGDHRVAMALALAGMAAEGETIINGAEAAEVTYTDFAEHFRKLGAHIEEIS